MSGARFSAAQTTRAFVSFADHPVWNPRASNKRLPSKIRAIAFNERVSIGGLSKRAWKLIDRKHDLEGYC